MLELKFIDFIWALEINFNLFNFHHQVSNTECSVIDDCLTPSAPHPHPHPPPPNPKKEYKNRCVYQMGGHWSGQ